MSTMAWSAAFSASPRTSEPTKPTGANHGPISANTFAYKLLALPAIEARRWSRNPIKASTAAKMIKAVKYQASAAPMMATDDHAVDSRNAMET